MATFKKTVIKNYPRVGALETQESLYWKHFEFPVTVKEFGAITHIEFSPVEPHKFAVTSSSRVQLYNPATNQVDKSLSRFRDVAYSGSFRSDGRLLVAGGGEGIVRLFDMNGRSVLRMFKGHQGPVHVSKFSSDNLHIMSCGDDKSVRCWDIPSEKETCRFTEHTDYVRCGVVSKASKDMWLTGSYDHKVKLFDTRTKKSVLTVEHGHPVESVVMFPAGGIFLSAGSNYIKVWDALAGGRLLTTLSNHHKTITSLCFNGAHNRLLTGSLDRHVKIYDVTSYKLVSNLDYPGPILSMSISPTDNTLVVGMATGLLSIQHRKPDDADEDKKPKKKRPQKLTYRYYDRSRTVYAPKIGDVIVPHEKKEFLEKYDRMLRRFQHSKALDAALQLHVRAKMPKVTISVFQELIRRGVMKNALSGRDEKWVRVMLTFLKRHLGDPNFAATVIDVISMLIDIYGSVISQSDDLTSQFQKLEDAISNELKYHRTLEEVGGMMDTLLAASRPIEINGSNGNALLDIPAPRVNGEHHMEIEQR
ncbi:U3 small nucleolar RNA-associated protein 15 homolog [Amphiura filiformis]|uniref:U3 small nucleolar RNA-associated protein 15 homolog n=1 Tax=Amphiura filiformis TaxID=82378 RepID=UPI003B213525